MYADDGGYFVGYKTLRTMGCDKDGNHARGKDFVGVKGVIHYIVHPNSAHATILLKFYMFLDDIHLSHFGRQYEYAIIVLAPAMNGRFI